MCTKKSNQNSQLSTKYAQKCALKVQSEMLTTMRTKSIARMWNKILTKCTPICKVKYALKCYAK